MTASSGMGSGMIGGRTWVPSASLTMAIGIGVVSV